jgi:hypothetical protein
MSMSNKERQQAWRDRQKQQTLADAQERAIKLARHVQRVAEIKAMTETQGKPTVSEAPTDAVVLDTDLVKVPRRHAELLAQLDELFSYAFIEVLYDGSGLTLLAFPTDLVERVFGITRSDNQI